MSTYAHAPTPVGPDTGPRPSRAPLRGGAPTRPARALPAWAIAAALAGCGGGPDGSSPIGDGAVRSDDPTSAGAGEAAEPPTFVGFFSLLEQADGGLVDVAEPYVNVQASFARTSSAPVPARGDDAVEIGSCRIVVESLDDEGGFPIDESSPGAPSRALDAGDALTLTSAAGTWATVPRTSFDDAGEPFYHLEPLVGSVPQGLVLDVPGAEFPGFANVPVPDLEPVALSAPRAGETLGADVRVAWNPAPADRTVVFYDVRTDEGFAHVSCEPDEPGTHVLADAVVGYLESAAGGIRSVSGVGVSRVSSGVVNAGDARLHVDRISIDRVE